MPTPANHHVFVVRSWVIFLFCGLLSCSRMSCFNLWILLAKPQSSLLANAWIPCLTVANSSTLSFSDGQTESLTTELALGTIDCNSTHHWHNAVVPSPRHSVSWSLPSPYLCSRRTVLKMCFCSCFLLIFNSGCKTTIFSWFCHYAKYSSLRNQKRVVRGASLCPILPIRLTKFNQSILITVGLQIRNQTTSLFLPKLHSTKTELPHISPSCLLFTVIPR